MNELEASINSLSLLLSEYTDQIINFLTNKGFLDENITKLILEPLLIAKDLSINITMLELYNYNHKQTKNSPIHFF